MPRQQPPQEATQKRYEAPGDIPNEHPPPPPSGGTGGNGNGELHFLAARMAMQMIQHANSGSTVARRTLANALGQQFGDDRDLYYVLGYKKELTTADYEERFDRQDIADRVVSAFPEATWKGRPEVYETEDPKETTKFEAAWEALVDGVDVWHYLRRVDILSGVGRYAVLFVGLDDGQDTSLQVTRREGAKLLYLQPYRESSAAIQASVTDRKDPRFGLPELYKLGGSDATGSSAVHHTRALHVADNLEQSDVYGTPRMKKVFNRLMDIEKIVGPSAEAFWRNIYPGLSFEMDPDAELHPDDREAMEDHIKEYIHGMNRFMMLQGVHTNQLQVQHVDPGPSLKAQVQMISSLSGIPTRLLMGSEQGELASSQDRANWNDRVNERRLNHAEPRILKPFVRMLIEAGVLPEPKEWSVRWPEEADLTPKEESEVDLNRARTLSEYVKHPGAEAVVPPDVFLVEHMGYEEDQAKEALESAGREDDRREPDPEPEPFEEG